MRAAVYCNFLIRGLRPDRRCRQSEPITCIPPCENVGLITSADGTQSHKYTCGNRQQPLRKIMDPVPEPEAKASQSRSRHRDLTRKWRPDKATRRPACGHTGLRKPHRNSWSQSKRRGQILNPRRTGDRLIPRNTSSSRPTRLPCSAA